MSLFITFEGIEGCGKTTQISHLADYLRQLGHSVVTTREPGGCAIADAIRNILLNPDNKGLVPRAELLLYAAARAQHVDEVVRPALNSGAVVLCDRYSDATLAYQGYGRGLDNALICHLNELASGGLVPRLTLLLDMPAADGLGRANRRNTEQDNAQESRFEMESLLFHQRIRQGYLELAQRDQQRFRVIDARGGIEEVALRIRQAVDPLLSRDCS
ncbi:thymidylate kinase [Desulfuromonas versatilis]|uniref:Thymidylate kinase n=1 Tax=Desulfuromonas versatilis TaxID=2802975 RepID=A0ABN6DYC8_9BACT|nr:dTMP kinase [Desulfuromonas versatilis]BCR05133.1 thymidylate kinase [Desulfuromonas versatilis]